MSHQFHGKWISDAELAALQPRNVFHRQLEPLALDCSEHRNRHVLFRKRLLLDNVPQSARIFITADDYYHLYVNGIFVAQGPAPSYHFQYNYNEIDLTPYLVKGENVIAVHTLYQGLVNRVWQSGDHRHGLLCDVEVDEKIILSSDESFLVAPHTGYTESGTCGYQTQFLERYDSRAAEVGFTGTELEAPKCVYREFADDKLVVITPNEPRFRPYVGRGLPIKKLLEEPFLSREKGSGTRKETEHFLRELGIDPAQLQTAVEVHSTESIIKMVSEGIGLAVLSKSACEDYQQFGKILTFDFDNITLRRKLYLIKHKNNILSPIAQVFYDYAKTFFKKEGATR